MNPTGIKARWAGGLLALAVIAPALVGSAASNSTAYAQAGSRTFPETGQTVKGRFLEYWQANGGLAQQGFPISAEMQEKSDTDGKTYMVQYFERAVFEAHPENKAPNDVLLSLLGNFLYKQKYPNGAPNQKASTDNPRKFAETGKTVGGKFRAYWEKNGGLAQQGFPISDEFTEKSDLDGKTYTVQYFERAVFELHPENAAPFDVLLSQLGTFRYRAMHGASGASSTPVPSTTNKEVTIKIVDFKFEPAVVTIAPGTKVTWTMVGPTVHNTVDKGKSGKVLWESPIMKPGETYSYTFTTPGEFEYWCTLHPDMEGKIIVSGGDDKRR